RVHHPGCGRRRGRRGAWHPRGHLPEPRQHRRRRPVGGTSVSDPVTGTAANLVQLAALAPLLALVGALINGLFGRSFKEPVPGILASTTVGAAFVLALAAFLAYPAEASGLRVELGAFLRAGDLSLDLGFMIDQLSLVMTLIITGIGFLIHVYSIGYMHGDPGY